MEVRGVVVAKEVVVRDTLTDDMIQAGHNLTECLDKSDLVVRSSLWLFMPESKIWRFVIASPEVEKDGPKKVYARVQKVLAKMSKDQPMMPTIPLKHISVVAPKDRTISSLRRLVKTGEKSTISGVSVTASAVDGHFIEDAFLYRST
jgi:hypothetical protein